MIPCLLLGLSLTCALIACGKGEGEEKSSTETGALADTSAAKSEPAEHLVPDEALLIIADLEGFVLDCGCSGSIKGGIPRAISAAIGAKELDVLLVGKNWASYAAIEAHGRQVAESNARALFEATRNRFRRVVEIDDTTLEKGFSWNGMQLSLERSPGGMSILVHHDGKIRRTMELYSRARSVGVLTRWGDPALAQNAFDGELGTHLSVDLASFSRSKDFVRRINDAINIQQSLHAAYYQLVDSRLTPDSVAAEAVQSATLQATHQPTGSGTQAPITVKSRFVGAWKETCGNCHLPQFERWKTSRHAVAFQTLVGKQVSSSPTCVHCHLNERGKGVDIAFPAEISRGIGCTTCHSPSGESPRTVRQTCLTCHDALTDPNDRWKDWIGKEGCVHGSDRILGPNRSHG